MSTDRSVYRWGRVSAVLVGLAISAFLGACNGDDSPTTTTEVDLYDTHAIFAEMLFNGARKTTLAVRRGSPVDPALDEGEIRTAEAAYDEAVAFDASLPENERILTPTGVMPDPVGMSDAQLEHVADLARGNCPPPGCETFGQVIERQVRGFQGD